MTKILTISIEITLPDGLLAEAEAIMKAKMHIDEMASALKNALGDAVGPLTYRQAPLTAPKPEPVPRKPRADRGTTRARKDAAPGQGE